MNNATTEILDIINSIETVEHNEQGETIHVDNINIISNPIQPVQNEEDNGEEPQLQMSVKEQFSGLDTEMLIGGPLIAVTQAQSLLAQSTADFINKVGFDDNGHMRMLAFDYQRQSVDDNGNSNSEAMRVSVPMLAIVPIPNLQIDEVNILFDMEVKQEKKDELSQDMDVSASKGACVGVFKASISGSVSSHESNTRNPDESKKYHVDVRATETPEGLSKVLEVLSAQIDSCIS